MITVLAGILMILILVLVHELGHCLVARTFGVGVKQFSIGFGPGIKIWQTKNFPVYFRFILLGGFVALKSREDQSSAGMAGKYLEDIYWWQKILVLAAGAGFNLILALILRILIFYFAPNGLEIKFLAATISFTPLSTWYLAPFQAIAKTFTLFAVFFSSILLNIWRIVLPTIPQAGAGVIGTIGLGSTIHSGFWAYCALICFVSIILAAANLLPFIPFDGGHIALTVFQTIFGQGLLFRIFKLIITYLGFFLLTLILLKALLSDIYSIQQKIK